MRPAAIPPAILPRVAQLVRMIGSPVDGEALAACRALGRTLAGAGADFHALAEAVERPAERIVVFPDAPRSQREKRPRKPGPSDVALDAAACRRVGEALWRATARERMSEWETEFVGSLADQMQAGRCRLTKKQGDALKRLLHRMGEDAAWV